MKEMLQRQLERFEAGELSSGWSLCFLVMAMVAWNAMMAGGDSSDHMIGRGGSGI
jgi:hypothetical protein